MSLKKFLEWFSSKPGPALPCWRQIDLAVIQGLQNSSYKLEKIWLPERIFWVRNLDPRETQLAFWNMFRGIFLERMMGRELCMLDIQKAVMLNEQKHALIRNPFLTALMGEPLLLLPKDWLMKTYMQEWAGALQVLGKARDDSLQAFRERTAPQVIPKTGAAAGMAGVERKIMVAG